MRIESWCDARLRDADGVRPVAVERTTVAGPRRALGTDVEPAAFPFGGSPSSGSGGGTE